MTLVSAGTAAILFGHAQAGVGARDSDEIIRTAPETFVDLNAQAPVPAAPTQKAETAAAPTPAPPLPIEAAETTARVMTEWAGPRLAQASETVAKYEPKVAVKFAQTQAGENRAKVTLALGSNRSGDVLDTLAHKVGYHANPRAAFGDRGRWYLFAATSNDAVGYNLLQGIQGQVHRAGFSSDRIAAATGDKQAGLAWRRGQLQASLAYVERELSTFGMSAQQRFVALTISLKGWGRPERAPQRASRWAPYEPAWQDQATEKDRRLSR